jgi:hypothetical protein
MKLYCFEPPEKPETIRSGEMAQPSGFSVAWAKRGVGLAGLKTSEWIEAKKAIDCL